MMMDVKSPTTHTKAYQHQLPFGATGSRKFACNMQPQVHGQKEAI
jgi:hypothetical protein